MTQHQKIISVLSDGKPHSWLDFQSGDPPHIGQYNARIHELRKRGINIEHIKENGYDRYVLITPIGAIDFSTCKLSQPREAQGELSL